MARLLIKTEGLENRTLELRLGVNRVGRSRDNDFPINHSTVSSHHCELTLTTDGVWLHDCGSTNGTFVNGDAVTDAWLSPGQELKFGDVELFIENVEVNVAIPQFDRAQPKIEPIMLEDGTVLCLNHPQSPVTYKCTNCNAVMCSACVHVLKRQGGQPLFLCPTCSHKCERIQAATAKKKKSFLGYLQDTVKLQFKHTFTKK